MNAPLSINTGQEKRFNNRYKMALPCRRYKIIPNGSFVHLLFQQSISLPFHLFSFIVLTSSLTSIKFEINILITRFFHFLDSLIVEIILRLYQKHSTHSYFMLLRGFGVMKKSPKNSKQLEILWVFHVFEVYFRVLTLMKKGSKTGFSLRF